MLPAPGAMPVDWRIVPGLMPYEKAVALMEAQAAAIATGQAGEKVLLVEHPPLFTAGTSAIGRPPGELRFPLYQTGRGGQLTYHGPGQRVCYVMLDLTRRRPDLRGFVAALESWMIATLGAFGIDGERREDRVGIWVHRPDKPRGPKGEPGEDKIAAIGIRVRRWVSFHGAALNIAPDLSHYAGIAPCGITESHLGVTSLGDLGCQASMEQVDRVLRREFELIFGATEDA
ncbi:MAG TPA: lipoyl(octanoyl) transferase LipB [Methylovirgula sp.]|nr:lipoyl(octanoyl) transferase LipB [Methylovirgula sp.]